MKYNKNAWAQLRNKSVDEIVTALIKDGFFLDTVVRTERVYRHPDGRKVSIHYHERSTTYRSGLLKSLLEDIGWTEKT